MRESTRKGSRLSAILLVVAYRELIDRYVDACKKAGITLSGIDLEAFALLRALAGAAGRRRQRSVCGARRRCDRARALDLRRLRRSRLRVHPRARLGRLGAERRHRPGDRRGSVRGRGLQARTRADGRDGPRRPQRRPGEEGTRGDPTGRSRPSRASSSPRLQYYQNQPGSLGIGEIVLTGGTAHLPGISGELERMIGVRVRVGDPLARMKVSKKVGEPEQIGSLAVAIGLGNRGLTACAPSTFCRETGPAHAEEGEPAGPRRRVLGAPRRGVARRDVHDGQRQDRRPAAQGRRPQPPVPGAAAGPRRARRPRSSSSPASRAHASAR